jgi:hypothetical protein
MLSAAVPSVTNLTAHAGEGQPISVFRGLDRVILDLHFDACHLQRDKDPGHYRRPPAATSGAW